MHPERELYIRKGLFRYVWWKVRVSSWLWFYTRGVKLPPVDVPPSLNHVALRVTTWRGVDVPRKAARLRILPLSDIPRRKPILP